MNEHKASRTLVKSPPELWAECSEASSLTRHLDQFGEIRITRLDPETAVAWEGERVSGTVRLEPSGWGTRVTLTATVDEPAPAAAPVADPEPPPEPVTAVEEAAPPEDIAPPVPEVTPIVTPPRRGGLFARLIAFLGSRPEPPPGPPAPALSEPEPAPDPEPEPEPETLAVGEDRCGFSPPEGGDLQQPDPAAVPEPELAPVVEDLMDAEAALVAALDSLGQAHHRPFSRA